jgi:hypothetical protein
MNKFLAIAAGILLALPLATTAQEKNNPNETVSIGSEYNRNLVKMNVMALSMTNFSFQYERALSRKFSVAMGASLRPLAHLPFNGLIHNQIKKNSNDTGSLNFVDRSKLSAWAFTPEVRFYLGKKPLNGFYIAPFARISGYNLSWSYLFVDQANGQHDIGFKGTATSITYGLLFGCQWHVTHNFLIDWWMMGPSYGSIGVNLNANTDMTVFSAQDRTKFQNEINSVFNDVGSSYGVSSATIIKDNGVFFSANSPFASIRTGLCIGLTF